MPTSLDLWLIAALGFLGSFGHCVGMCGPLAAAFALSVQSLGSESGQRSQQSAGTSRAAGKSWQSNWQSNWQSSIRFHILLNLGRLLSYALVGAGIGGLGAVIFAGGQLAGVGSVLRRTVSIFTGILLIWFGFTQAKPGLLPSLPFLHPARQQRIHEQLNQLMVRVSGSHRSSDRQAQWQLPLLLGLLWGLIPCGFLYAGQLRAAETQSWIGGAAIMLAFGAGTMPAMIGMGAATSLLSRDRRSQLFRIGGWLTILIGLLLLVRTGDTMSDYSGHGALICLVAALIARPISLLWSAPLRYRRILGVGAFALSLLHVLHMVSHTWNWNMQAVQFMLPTHQIGVALGMVAVVLMTPGTVTSFNRAQKALGNRWRKLHLLGVPALLLSAIHTLLIGASYWGALAITWQHQVRVITLLVATGLVLAVRSPHLWSFFSLKKYYAPPKSSLAPAESDRCCSIE